MMFRNHIDNKYGLLFGGYYPMGIGVGCDEEWQTAIKEPIRGQGIDGRQWVYKRKGLTNSFYKTYNGLHVPSWRSGGGGGGSLKAGGYNKANFSIALSSDICHPLLDIVSTQFVGFKQGDPRKAKAHQVYTGQGIQYGGMQIPTAAAPLQTLGLTMAAACKASGQSESLGFASGFSNEITSYIKKHFGSIPNSRQVANFIGGQNPVEKKNWFLEANVSISGAQSCWSNLEMMVGPKGGDEEASYGLPHKYTRGSMVELLEQFMLAIRTQLLYTHDCLLE